MKQKLIKESFEKFEAASNVSENIEYWSARELQELLGYSQWKNFENVIEKAKKSALNAGVELLDHFSDIGKMIEIAKGAQREIDDVDLTRYACYLVAQNGDSAKSEIAFAQTYLG